MVADVAISLPMDCTGHVIGVADRLRQCQGILGFPQARQVFQWREASSAATKIIVDYEYLEKFWMSLVHTYFLEQNNVQTIYSNQSSQKTSNGIRYTKFATCFRIKYRDGIARK